jgi:nicotinamide mononucleotide (NMN) deamidase PncC
MLAERHETLATVEWGTAGLVTQWLGEVVHTVGTDEKAPFRAGLVVGDIGALETLLPPVAGLAARHGPISGEVASAMASACREKAGADYGLAIGQFPPFEPQAAEPASYFFALASRSAVVVRSSPFAAHPAILVPRAGKQALNLLRLALLKDSALKEAAR